MLQKFFIVSCIIFVASLVWAYIQYRVYDRNKIFTPRIILTMGAAAASIVWFIPIYIHSGNPTCDSVAFSILNTIKLFGADGIKGIVDDNYSDVARYYKVFGEVLSLWAPFLSFTLILSFFKRAKAYFGYSRFWKKTYVFSELNDKSLALATSIRKSKGGHKCIIVFADIVDKNEESHLDLVDGAKEIRAILFRKDLEAVKWALNSKRMKRSIDFYLISEDECEKIRHAKNIVARYNNEKCSLFIFSNTEESKNLLSSYNFDQANNPLHIKITRIDDIRLLTYTYLSDNGHCFFRRIPKMDKLETINVAIVGFGSYGIEMLRALLWYCQMPGYKVNITVIDQDPKAQSRFEAMFPSLKVNQDFDEANDMRYRIEFKHSAYGEKQFLDDIQGLPDDSFFFVFTGDDEVNMLASDSIRRAMEQASKPGSSLGNGDVITTVIYNTDVKDLVAKDINVIGDLSSFYSCETFKSNGFVEDGFKEHLLWADKKVNLFMFGCGKKEERALKTVAKYCQIWKYDINVTVYKKNVTAAEEREDATVCGIKAKFKVFDIQEFNEYIGNTKNNIHRNNSLIICFGNNGVTKAKQLPSGLIVPIFRHYFRFSIWKFFKKMNVARAAANRNGYHLSDYNFYSSISKALHRRLRSKILEFYSDPYHEILNLTKSIHESQKLKDQIKNGLEKPEERESARKKLNCAAYIEHVRWNAYMRTEGFIYGKKNTQFKMHDNLVTVEELSDELKLKDI